MIEIEGKYFTTSDYNKFMSDILDAEIKYQEIVNRSDISNLVENSDWNTRLATLAKKEELEAAQDKIEKLEAFDSSLFCLLTNI